MGDKLPKINEVTSTEVRNAWKDELYVKYVENCGGSVSEVKLLIGTQVLFIAKIQWISK